MGRVCSTRARKNGRPPQVRVVQRTNVTFHTGIRSRPEETERADGSDLTLRRQFTCFPKHEAGCRELGPRNGSRISVHFTGKQRVMGRALHGNFPVRKRRMSVTDELFQTHNSKYAKLIYSHRNRLSTLFFFKNVLVTKKP